MRQFATESQAQTRRKTDVRTRHDRHETVDAVAAFGDPAVRQLQDLGLGFVGRRVDRHGLRCGRYEQGCRSGDNGRCRQKIPRRAPKTGTGRPWRPCRGSKKRHNGQQGNDSRDDDEPAFVDKRQQEGGQRGAARRAGHGGEIGDAGLFGQQAVGGADHEPGEKKRNGQQPVSDQQVKDLNRLDRQSEVIERQAVQHPKSRQPKRGLERVSSVRSPASQRPAEMTRRPGPDGWHLIER